VKCNGGSDFTMKKSGQTFQCTADQNRAFTVTITNTDGHYQVQPNG
jgi:hypothetical protein